MIVPAMQVMELGTMAVVTDAGGAAIGIWQPGLHKGSASSTSPAHPNGSSSTPATTTATVSFYRDVFQWDTHTVERRRPSSATRRSARATTGSPASWTRPRFLPDGVPANWSIYFAVEDTDAALAQVAELGGSVVEAADDTPYGRLARAADPTGSLFKLVADMQ